MSKRFKFARTSAQPEIQPAPFAPSLSNVLGEDGTPIPPEQVEVAMTADRPQQGARPPVRRPAFLAGGGQSPQPRQDGPNYRFGELHKWRAKQAPFALMVGFAGAESGLAVTTIMGLYSPVALDPRVDDPNAGDARFLANPATGKVAYLPNMDIQEVFPATGLGGKRQKDPLPGEWTAFCHRSHPRSMTSEQDKVTWLCGLRVSLGANSVWIPRHTESVRPKLTASDHNTHNNSVMTSMPSVRSIAVDAAGDLYKEAALHPCNIGHGRNEWGSRAWTVDTLELMTTRITLDLLNLQETLRNVAQQDAFMNGRRNNGAEAERDINELLMLIAEHLVVEPAAAAGITVKIGAGWSFEWTVATNGPLLAEDEIMSFRSLRRIPGIKDAINRLEAEKAEAAKEAARAAAAAERQRLEDARAAEAEAHRLAEEAKNRALQDNEILRAEVKRLTDAGFMLEDQQTALAAIIAEVACKLGDGANEVVWEACMTQNINPAEFGGPDMSEPVAAEAPTEVVMTDAEIAAEVPPVTVVAEETVAEVVTEAPPVTVVAEAPTEVVMTDAEIAAEAPTEVVMTDDQIAEIAAEAPPVPVAIEEPEPEPEPQVEEQEEPAPEPSAADNAVKALVAAGVPEAVALAMVAAAPKTAVAQ